MKNLVLFVFSLTIICPSISKADEGMWLPMLIDRNYSEMKKMGLKLTPEEIYSVNNSSLKDAVVSFGGFCTGEMISSEGLLLTNHHCGFDAIRTHSTTSNDYLTNGFWAMSKDEEKPNADLSVTYLVRMEDVSTNILKETDSLIGQEKSIKINALIEEIEANAVAESHYTAEVKSFFEGNAYYLFVYETFLDVRLVGAPPSSIGKYGGDTDNWMWPRHTGDFALFRVYCAPDGSPAVFSEENIPYTPRHFLPISLDGVENGDFAMVLGYPGSTDRFLTSFGVQEALDQVYPARIMIRDKKLKIMKTSMDASDEVRLKYASKYASTSNYWKYFIGQSKGLKRMRVYEQKQETESLFNAWVQEKEDRVEVYGNVLTGFNEAYEAKRGSNVAREFLVEAFFQGPAFFYFSFLINDYLSALQTRDPKQIQKKKEELAIMAISHFSEYDFETDKNLFAGMLDLYWTNMNDSQKASVVKEAFLEYNGDWNAYANDVYEKSVLVDLDRFLDYLEYDNYLFLPLKIHTRKLQQDPAYAFFASYYGEYVSTIAIHRRPVFSQLTSINNLWVKGLQEQYPNKLWYPNANFSMRVTFGSVGDYTPGDAMHYNYTTTIDGLFEKEDPKNEEFIVPQKLTTLYLNKDYGQYADKNGQLHVNLITNNDITGGNSGSPLINANGELIGCAFDGNWEAMSGDIAFEKNIQRTISVDARYILFIIDKFAGATHLIDEMKIVKSQ